MCRKSYWCLWGALTTSLLYDVESCQECLISSTMTYSSWFRSCCVSAPMALSHKHSCNPISWITNDNMLKWTYLSMLRWFQNKLHILKTFKIILCQFQLLELWLRCSGIHGHKNSSKNTCWRASLTSKINVSSIMETTIWFWYHVVVSRQLLVAF